jgi:uncharacterized membrane protein
MQMFGFILTYLVLNTLGLTLLKLGTQNVKLDSFSDYAYLLMKPQFIFGFFLYAASFLTWVMILSKKDISYIFPMVIGLSYFCVMIVAVFFLKDTLTINKIIGSVLIGLGVIVISL